MDGWTELAELTSGPVEYRVVPGHREVVVLFHGGHVRAGLAMGEKALVEAGYTVLAPSRPGYGRTPLYPDPTPATFAQRTAELCTSLGVGPVLAAVGISAGGPTAVAFAAQQPARVQSLVLLSARSSLPWPGRNARLAGSVLFHPKVEGLSWAATRLLLRRAPTLGLRVLMDSLSSLPGTAARDDLDPAEQREVAEMFAGMRSGSGFRNDLRTRADPGLERTVRQPTLVVASRADGRLDWQHVRQLTATIAGAAVFESPSLSHLVWLGSGGPVTQEAVLRFLEDVR